MNYGNGITKKDRMQTARTKLTLLDSYQVTRPKIVQLYSEIGASEVKLQVFEIDAPAMLQASGDASAAYRGGRAMSHSTSLPPDFPNEFSEIPPDALEQWIECYIGNARLVYDLIEQGNPHLALAQANFLRQCGHPQGEKLMQDAQEAITIRTQRVTA